MTEAQITVSTADEDGYCAVAVTRDGETEELYLRSDEVGDFIASERELEDLSSQAADAGVGLFEFTCSPFGLEWEREQADRNGRPF